MLKLQRQGRIGTFPLCTGQEAASCGPALAMTPNDWFVGSFRELAGRLLRGEPIANSFLLFNGFEEGNAFPGGQRTLPVSIIIAVEAGTGQALDDAVTIATVDRIVDGDTIDITWPTGATASVRLIGVDTPETVQLGSAQLPFSPTGETECYGPETSDYVKTLLPEGAQIRLQFDRQRLDSYRRTLAYVYTADGNQMINALLLENGYARVLIVGPNSQHAALFYSLEDQAKAEERGLWEACPESVEGKPSS